MPQGSSYILTLWLIFSNITFFTNYKISEFSYKLNLKTPKIKISHSKYVPKTIAEQYKEALKWLIIRIKTFVYVNEA
jgi:hypothetical protein